MFPRAVYWFHTVLLREVDIVVLPRIRQQTVRFFCFYHDSIFINVLKCQF